MNSKDYRNIREAKRLLKDFGEAGDKSKSFKEFLDRKYREDEKNPEAVRLDKELNKILGDLNGVLQGNFVGTEVFDAFDELSKKLFDPSNRTEP